MSITAEAKQQLIKQYAASENDTGSVQVQCAVLTARINNLTEHFKTNKKDFASKRGLLILVGRRRRLLKYLKAQSIEKYLALISQLGIRK